MVGTCQRGVKLFDESVTMGLLQPSQRGNQMDLKNRFDDEELERIIEEAAIYMCACPGQVANQIRQLRQVIRYQRDCLTEAKTPNLVHHTIEARSREAHALMEDCLDQVLEIEGWDRVTLKMPAGLRKLRDELIENDN